MVLIHHGRQSELTLALAQVLAHRRGSTGSPFSFRQPLSYPSRCLLLLMRRVAAPPPSREA